MSLVASCGITMSPYDVISIATSTLLCVSVSSIIVNHITMNHTSECSICERNQTCDLQDYTHTVASGMSSLMLVRSHGDAPESASIKIVLDRCVSCYRCVHVTTIWFNANGAIAMLMRSSFLALSIALNALWSNSLLLLASPLASSVMLRVKTECPGHLLIEKHDSRNDGISTIIVLASKLVCCRFNDNIHQPSHGCLHDGCLLSVSVICFHR